MPYHTNQIIIQFYLILMRNKDEGENKEFKFENAWLVEENFENIVIGGWEEYPNVHMLSGLKSCTEDMNKWGRKLLNKYTIAIDECREETY